MLKLVVAALAATAASAATWYGIAPDNTVPGVVTLFTMTADGKILNGVASIATSDVEYPKTGTLQCLWGSPVCYFLTGVGGDNIQDKLYAVNRLTGVTLFKRTIPAGIFVNNLALDWMTDTLYSVAFNPAARTAVVVSYNGTTGMPTILTDITQSLNGGFIWPGTVTVCPFTQMMYMGVDNGADGGAFEDFVINYNYASKAVTYTQLVFPIPSSLHAFCNASRTILAGATIQADSGVRETALLGEIIETATTAAVFVPLSRGDLPTITQNGEQALFLTGMVSEFNGTFLATAYPPINPGPGPAPAIPYGGVWTDTVTGGRPTAGSVSPINYYLAGASGVPNQ